VDDETVRVAVPDPPDERVTLDGLMETVSPEKDLLTDRVTLPEKPATDVSVIVDVLEPPTGTFTMFGDAVRVKSAVAWATATDIDVDLVVYPPDPVTVTV